MSKQQKQHLKKTTSLSIIFSLIIAISVSMFSFLNISLFPPKVEIQEIKKSQAAGENWYSAGGTWNYRKKITIDHTKVADVANPSTAYANFPVLVSTTGLSNIKANGADIRFTSSDGVTELPREIESYDSGALEAWVKLTLTKDAEDGVEVDDDIIYMYYGNASVTEPVSGDDGYSEDVWDTNFEMVQHLQETDIDGGTGDIKDSTGNSNDGTTSGMDSNDQVAGQIDGGLDFDGVDDYIVTTDDAININTVTVCAWIKPPNAYQAIGTIVSDEDFQFYLAVKNNPFERLVLSSNHGVTNVHSSVHSIALEVWQNVCVVRLSDGNTTFYVNGEQSGNANQNSGTPTNSYSFKPSIGARSDGAYPINSLIDEVRISNTARSTEWIKTGYNNQSSSLAFATFDNLETNLSCAEAGGTCKTNSCSVYIDCLSLAGACNTGNCCSGACEDDTTSPVISNISSSSITQNSAIITWTTNEDSTSQVEYGQTISYGNQTIEDTNLITSHSVNLISLSSGTTYHYRIKSKDASDNEAISTDYFFTTAVPDTQAPTTPTNLTATAISSSQIDLSWTASTDNTAVTGYNIYRNSVLINTSTTNSYSDTELQAETTYIYTVSAYDAVPNTSGQSNSANAITPAGNVINVASCEQDDVQAAIDLAIDGETVAVSAGECIWTTAINWTDKNISVIGAGENNTVINVGGTGFSVRTDTKAAFRISSMTINQTVNGKAIIINNIKQYPTGGTYSKGWRLDHLTITANGLNDVRSIFVFGLTYGVVDHVTWSSDYSFAQFLTHYAYTNDNSELDGQPFNQGTISWGLEHPLGDANAIYVENSTLNASATGGWAADVWLGGSVVFRYNTINRCQISTHGARFKARGGKRMEIYNNKFVRSGMNDSRFVWWRSGSGVVFNNTMESTGKISIDNQRTCLKMSSRCDGNSPYDGNIADNGWPCLDQPGRGYGAPTNQTSEPIYAWYNGEQEDCRTSQATCVNTENISVGSNYDLCLSASPPVLSDHLKTGTGHIGGIVDYVNNGTTPKHGYTPYTYPHPLRNESCPDTTPPTRFNSSPSGALDSGTASAILSLTTNENATCKYSITPNIDYALIPNTLTTTGNTTHSQTITGLTDGTSYSYYVRCIDASSNANTNDYAIIFSIAKQADTTPPIISNISTFNITTNSAQINFTTNENTTSYIEYGLTTSYGSQTETNATGTMNYPGLCISL